MFTPHNVSRVTCHMSRVICHVSQFFFWTKWWSLLVEGLLSTGPTPSSLWDMTFYKLSFKNSRRFEFYSWVSEKIFWSYFLHIMTHFYPWVQMKSIKDFKCGWIIPVVDIKKGKNSQFFDEITIKVSPPIYTFCPLQSNFIYVLCKTVGHNIVLNARPN